MKRSLLKLFKSHEPKELEEWVKKFPELEDDLRDFVHSYHYNYVSKTWKKRKI